MPPKQAKRKQTGRGQVASRVAEALEETYYDFTDFIETKKQYIEDRLKVLTKEKKKKFIQTYVSKMQELLTTIPPEMRQCLNVEFPDMLFHSNTRYEQTFYKELRPIVQYILPDEEERRRLLQTRDVVAFYTRILERLNDEAFLKAYLKKYSKPINMYAFYLVRTLKQRLKLDIRVCLYRLEMQQAQQTQRITPQDTREYKNRLTTPEKNNFTYRWLKTEDDIKAVCKDTDGVADDDADDECDCTLLMTPLQPNKAFAVSYELKGNTFTECFDEIIVFREAALPYKYYRHHILRDKFIDMGAIRALKAAANAPALSSRRSPGGAKPAKPAKPAPTSHRS